MGENSESKVDISAVSDVKDKLNFAVNQFAANIPLCSNYSIFSILADAGFDTSCCNTYDAGVKELSSKLSSLISALGTYISNVEEADKEIEKEIPVDDTPDKDNDNGEKKDDLSHDEKKDDGLGDVSDDINKGDNKDGKSGNPDEDKKDDKDKKTPLNKPKNNNPDMNKIYEEFSKYYGNMSKKSLVSLISSLYDEAFKRGITIEELLSSDKYNSVILSFMNNSSLSSEMRDRMKSLGVDISGKMMHDYLVGDKSVVGYNEKNKKYIYDSLEQYCKNANQTTDSILNSIDGSLRNVLNNIEKSIKEQNGNTSLLETILGFDDNKIAEILSSWKK